MWCSLQTQWFRNSALYSVKRIHVSVNWFFFGLDYAVISFLNRLVCLSPVVWLPLSTRQYWLQELPPSITVFRLTYGVLQRQHWVFLIFDLSVFSAFDSGLFPSIFPSETNFLNYNLFFACGCSRKLHYTLVEQGWKACSSFFVYSFVLLSVQSFLNSLRQLHILKASIRLSLFVHILLFSFILIHKTESKRFHKSGVFVFCDLFLYSSNYLSVWSLRKILEHRVLYLTSVRTILPE